MKKNWTLHIFAHKGRAGGRPTYTLGICPEGQHLLQRAAMPIIHHSSWQHLSKALAAVGVEAPQLMDLKAKLEESAFDIHEVPLDAADIQRLGFTAQQVPPRAFS